LKVFLSLLISLLFFSLFLYFVPVEELLDSLKDISPSSLLLAFFLYSLSVSSREAYAGVFSSVFPCGRAFS